MMKKKWICFLAVMTGLAWQLTAAPVSDVGLSGLTDPRGLEDPLYRWTARVITPNDLPGAAEFYGPDSG